MRRSCNRRRCFVARRDLRERRRSGMRDCLLSTLNRHSSWHRSYGRSRRLPVIGAVVPVGTSSAGTARWRFFPTIRSLLESGHCPLIGNHRLSISKSW